LDLLPLALELEGPQAGVEALVGHRRPGGFQLSGEDLLDKLLEKALDLPEFAVWGALLPALAASRLRLSALDGS